MLGILCAAIVLSLTTWFSATAITPELAREFDLSPAALAWLTNGVQVGFVAGALSASLVNLPDVVRLSRLMAASALLAGLANAALLLEPGVAGMVAARVVTGAALAGVYPPALKLVATWFVRDRGLALGMVIGALTLGSAMPHLFRGLTAGVDWRLVVAAASLATVAGAALFALFAREGPYPFGRAVFDHRQIGAVFRNRPLLLVNLGYFGHMWELYAAWAWLLVFLSASPVVPGPGAASVLTFAAVAAGVAGCLLGGVLSDRIGRSLTTAGMMLASAACAALIGLAFDGPLWALAMIALVWGVAIIGDSAQFSAAATELADSRYVGTALSVQLGTGFALTVLTIWLLPLVAEWAGSWRWAFLALVPGPLVGAAAMLALRRMPESKKMAGGRG